jgi:hypothetical protein
MTEKPAFKIAIDRHPREVRRLSGLSPLPRKRKPTATSAARKAKWRARKADGKAVVPIEVSLTDVQIALATVGLLKRDELGDRALIAQHLGYVIRLWIRSTLGTRSNRSDTICK